MKPIFFSNTIVNRFRQEAVKAREIPHNDSDWSYDGNVSFAHDHANKLLGVFDSLWLKPGFALYAYVYRTGGNGNGRIWAVPTDVLAAMPLDRLTLADDRVRQPAGAVQLMQAIEGDRSPWSYPGSSNAARIWPFCACPVAGLPGLAPREGEAGGCGAGKGVPGTEYRPKTERLRA